MLDHLVADAAAKVNDPDNVRNWGDCRRSHVAYVLIFATRELLPAVGIICVENPCLSNTRD